MKVGFEYKEAEEREPVRIEQVIAEKPGGGMVANQEFDVLPTTAVYEDENGQFKPIKAYRLAADITADDTTIQIEKGSGIKQGDILGTGKKSVACTAVTEGDTTTEVTVSLGVALKKGTVLYQAKSVSATTAAPLATPIYVTGNTVYGNKGDQPVRLINIANLRKETANIASEVAALLPGITLV